LLEDLTRRGPFPWIHSESKTVARVERDKIAFRRLLPRVANVQRLIPIRRRP
jgi:hypothetical protein